MNSTQLSDEQIIEIIREKNQELYGEIIKRYQLKLSHYLRKYIADPDELEDILQEVFIKTFRNLHQFNSKKKFSSWIYRISHNEAVNHLKKNSKAKVPLDEVEFQLFDESLNLNDKVDQVLLKQLLEKHLASLKSKYREPLILYYFEHQTYEEISEILRLPKNTVGTLISRGKKQLREILTTSKIN